MNLVVVMRNLLSAECLGLALSYQAGLNAVLMSPSTSKLIYTLQAKKTDLILIDAELQHDLALTLTKLIVKKFPAVKVIVIGGLNQEGGILECIEAGAHGFFLKEASIADLTETIYITMRGEANCTPRLAYFLFSRLSELSRENSDLSRLQSFNLTSRELQVLSLVAEGLCNKQIAQHFNLSLHTVKNHVHNILEKLRLSNRSEIVSFAIGNGLVTKNYSKTSASLIAPDTKIKQTS